MVEAEISSFQASPSGFLRSLNHPVRPRQYIRRDCQADLLGGLEIDDELEFRWLLHREIGGLCAFKDFVNISSRATIQVYGPTRRT